MARPAFVLTVLAFAWSAGLLIAALVAPVYGSATLVEQNGAGVLVAVAVPAVVSAAAWIALWRKCSRGGRAGGYIAWACVAALFAYCLVAIFSIGVFIAPVVVLLACATYMTPSDDSAAQGSAPACPAGSR